MIQLVESRTLTAVAEDAARKLVRVRQGPGYVLIDTPLMYPSGAIVVVRVDAVGPNEFFLSDMGLGYEEAEQSGMAAMFVRHAKTVAEEAGIGFDTRSFFVVKVEEGQLPGAVATVANASHETTIIAWHKHEEKRAELAEDLLVDRLLRLFPKKVEARTKFFGASHTALDVSAVVKGEKGVVVFEAVARHPNSIFAASSKFHDFALLENPPISIAVVHSKKALGTYHEMLGQAAHVVEEGVSDNRIRELARAA